ncbi:MAG: lytic transglycosylase domain-containing protein, partial [Nitrospirae bacterium]|nr:lytic transglycosylase domain-containing protein [Nitrospirota bacterium]
TDANAFCFEEAGRAYGINPLLIEGIAKTESNLNPKALNKNQNGSVDMGLMQVNSFWIKALGLSPHELISDPCYNTMAGTRILRECINRLGYTWEAVGCYNAKSMNKKVAYSWKIFNKLKVKDKGTKVVLKQMDKELNTTGTINNSSLFFRARGIASPSRTETEMR